MFTMLLLLFCLFSFAFAQDLVNCSLCVDPDAVPNDPDARFSTGTETLTCQDMYERGNMTLTQANCTLLHNIGRELCLCESDLPVFNDNCTLCQDGSDLPKPLHPGLPNITCAELQIDAKRDDEANCLTWQQTVGVYCGCQRMVDRQSN